MKILSAQQMQTADKQAIEGLKIPSLVLMENAGRAISNALLAQFPDEVCRGVLILTGSGNNAGDGFVVARMLLGHRIPVQIVSLKAVEQLDGDALHNAKIAVDIGIPIQIFDGTLKTEKFGIVLDALFGTGLKGALREPAVSLVERLNASKAMVVSVDIASGVDASTGKVAGVAVKAKHTYALQCLKWGNLISAGEDRAGSVRVLDIGIPMDVDAISSARSCLITENELLSRYQFSSFKDSHAHKGTRGHVLVLGGSAGKYGAPKLSARAALLNGAGLVSIGLPRSAASRVSVGLEELMSVSFEDDESGNFKGDNAAEIESALEGKRVLAIGPGLGESEGAARLLESCLRYGKNVQLRTVLDADALNLIATRADLRKFVHRFCVLTPHPGEMARLMDKKTSEVQSNRKEMVTSLAAELGCTVVLKGSKTIIATDGADIWLNPVSDGSLATAGSGDVLTGIIAALLLRECAIDQACAIGVFAHGVSGTIRSALNHGYLGTIAGDIPRVSAVVLNALVELSSVPIPSEHMDSVVIPGAYERLRKIVLSQIGQ